ncbi:DUF2851 family protein [Flavobacteriaceae bacterium LMO-SS05]
MQEEFLHYIWKHKKLDVRNLKTTKNEPIEIISVGQHNLNSGPDFFNAQLKLGHQLWAGNVEIHIKSSDWFVHNHEQDKAYDNVILHVVWEHNIDIHRKDNSEIPTLELKNCVDSHLLVNYNNLFSKQNKWINCEYHFADVDAFILDNWLERLYFERLERKSNTIQELLAGSNNDWEAVLFKLLARTFGLKVNGDAFFSLAQSIDFSVIRKLQSKPEHLEALLFGQAGFLDSDVQDSYYISLAKDYQFLKQKYQLDHQPVLPIQFFRLHPPNFPTIRLSQLAMVYSQHQNLFSKIMSLQTLSEFYELFEISTSSFWETHYTFEKQSKASIKSLTKPFIDLILINTILPLKFCYSRHIGQQIEDQIITIASGISSEVNSIIKAYNSLKKVSQTALQSQALIQLKSEYCDKNKCLQCAIGNSIIAK